jgi:uncharacterized lipoprotein YddW (UPF0748 family)
MSRRLGVGALLLAALPVVLSRGAAGAGRGVPAAGEEAEVRALWVQRTSLTSPTAIVSLVASAKDAGFNTLLVQVRGRGDAYYDSRLEPRGSALSKQPLSFDPLALVVAQGHRAGLRVHAWVNVNLISDADPPAARNHVVYEHPEWLMVPREIALEMAGLDRRSPEYLGRLSRYARAHSDQIEGLYLSPLHPQAAEHSVKVIADIAARYAIDGIHLDYIRFPSDEFDYSAEALAQFRADVLPRLSDAERRQYEGRREDRPLYYTQMFPQRWQDFRRARLTALVTRLRAAIKAKRPGAVLSAAVLPDAAEAANRRLQDWRGWAESGLLDVVCPMAYTVDPAVFRSQIAAAKQLAAPRPVWAGIGSYHLSAAETIENIFAARRLGAEGVILFSYDNLIAGDDVNSEYLSIVGRVAFRP